MSRCSRTFSVLICWLALALSLAAQALPELPAVPYDKFEAGIRAQMRQALADAQAKPQDAAANGKLGMVLHTYEQHEAAIIGYTRASHYAPQDFRWHYYRGLSQAALAQYTEAIASFKEALRLQPAHVPAQLRFADTLLAAGQPRTALPLYETLAKQSATNAQAQYGLGQIKIAFGDKAAGVAHYREALKLFPEYGAVHYALGLALRDQGQRSEAQYHLAQSQQFKYRKPPLEDPLLEALADLNASATDQLARGVVFANMGKLEPAVAAHERALEINPKLVQAHINLISLYAQLGQIAKAEKHYYDAVTENPNLADSYFNYGIVLMRLDRYSEAASEFLRSLERNPFNADAHYNYGIIIEREGRLDEAAEHYRQALANNPEHRLTRFHLARILVNQNKLAEAIENLQLTLAVDDDDTPRFTYALGATLIRHGERQQGIERLREALKKAQARGQVEVAAAVERDLKALEQSR